MKAQGAGFVDYLWPQPGAEQPVPKISYVKGFAPWGWIIGSGIYIDDVNAHLLEPDADARRHHPRSSCWSPSLISVVIARSISRPLARTHRQHDASGRWRSSGIAVDGTDNKAEMGALARALAVFKDNALAIDKLAAERAGAGRTRPPVKSARRCSTLPPISKLGAACGGPGLGRLG